MRVTFLIIALFLQAVLFAQLSDPTIHRLDSIATQDVPKGAPGIATGIVQNGKIVYQKVAGFASLPDSTLITRTSRFNIASNGKQFTALAVLMLIDEKKLSLADDIRKFLPGLYPGIKTPITIGHLLTHSSGIRDVYDLWSLQGITWWQQSFGNKDVIRLLEKQQDLNFPPGSKYLYSNSNYILLATIVEKVTGRSFIAITNDMFRKLGMHNTSFESDAQKIRGPIARAYFNFGTWTTYDWIWNVVGDGNIFSTLEDQLIWEQVLQNKGFRVKGLGSSQTLVAGSAIKNYGYGLEFGTYKGMSYTFHEGATGAWKATVIRFPEKKVSMVTLVNTGKATPNTQTRQMADVFFKIPNNASFWLTKPAAEGPPVKDEEIIGTYVTEDDFAFQFEQREGKLYLKRVGRNDVLLEREGANIFHQAYDPLFKQEFLKNAKGERTVTAYYTSHAPYTLTKLNANFEGFDFASLAGKYLNTETDVMISIQHSGGKNYAIQNGSDSTRGLLVTPTKMLVDSYVLEFREGSFLLSGDRIQGVVFRKE
jgi:CubicO group peptidase (beta-lactamase class C family)